MNLRRSDLLPSCPSTQPTTLHLHSSAVFLRCAANARACHIRVVHCIQHVW